MGSYADSTCPDLSASATPPSSPNHLYSVREYNPRLNHIDHGIPTTWASHIPLGRRDREPEEMLHR